MKRRRAVVILIVCAGVLGLLFSAPALLFGAVDDMIAPLVERVMPDKAQRTPAGQEARSMLAQLPVKGRAPKTGYARSQFGDGWAKKQGCSTREIILYRDMTHVTMRDECSVQSGVLDDPYTGEIIHFSRADASAVQIDHVVALSNAWQTGAQNIPKEQRRALANDPLNLLAVDGPANQQKSDADAATWLPKNKAFRCQYAERQVAVKQRYSLWVTRAEEAALHDILTNC